jgi:hypothetical protein
MRAKRVDAVEETVDEVVREVVETFFAVRLPERDELTFVAHARKVSRPNERDRFGGTIVPSSRPRL